MEQKKVLLADAEPFIRDTLKIKLQSKGYQVILATSARELIRAAGKEVPDLIIMEINFADLEGHRICQFLKGNKKTENIPIIILTSRPDTPENIFLYSAWAKEYITKPFSPRLLLKKVEKALS